MKIWMSESVEEIITNWKEGTPIKITGNLHGKRFENNGMILSFDPMLLLEYTHLNSISELTDVSENYSVFSFSLDNHGDKTNLSLSIHNFPTETIYKHLAFYWNVTLEIFKRFTENKLPIIP